MDNTELRHHCLRMGYSDDEVGAFYDGYEHGMADEKEKALDDIIDIIAVACKFDEYNKVEMKQYILEKLKEQE